MSRRVSPRATRSPASLASSASSASPASSTSPTSPVRVRPESISAAPGAPRATRVQRAASRNSQTGATRASRASRSPSRTSRNSRASSRTSARSSSRTSPVIQIKDSEGIPTDAALYEAATAPTDIFAGHQPRNIYGDPRSVEPQAQGIEFFYYKPWPIWSALGDDEKTMYTVASEDGMSQEETQKFKIAFSRWQKPGSTGPFVLINHGVPANQTQWYDVARLLALAGFRVVVFDMLTMGWSSKPLFSNEDKLERLRWVYDPPYVNALADYVFGANQKFIYLADDWGTGILQKYLEQFGNRVLWFGDQDGIRGGAYPVPEIEAIGRASMLPMDMDPEVLAGRKPPMAKSFQFVMAGSDQTIVQILKTMAHRAPERYNQWSMRDTLRPFYSVDYERPADPKTGYPGAAPFNMPPKFFALKSMADRAVSALRSGDLMPYHPEKNQGGIKFSQIKGIGLFYSGEYDKMMSANQRLRYKFWMPRAQIFSQLIPRADHFSGVDQPEWIATMLVEFHNGHFPPGSGPLALPAIFLGFDGVWKGNEQAESAAYQALYQ